jgi:SAM-dependent methyltransferase
MQTYTETTYGDKIADIYDDWYENYQPAAIETLAALAQGGPALELGIGTGRIALPLQDKGIMVHGIEASEKMVARLQAKPGGYRIPITLGDFGTVPVTGHFPLIYVVFNTLFALRTQDEQLRCFKNVAAHLTPDGVFVTETFMPDMKRFQRDQSIHLVAMDDGYLRIDVTRHDPVQQTIYSQHVAWTESGARFYPVRLRYIWPSELNLMAQLAGLMLAERWGDWDKRPFDQNSSRLISVFKLARE